VARQAFDFLKRGIRINAIMPGPTDTPLARAQADLWLGFGRDYRDETETKPSTPEQQAFPLVFLCSDAASYVNGITLITDLGYVSAGVTGSFAPAAPVVNFLLGKY
jgi:NAD(P)-dependent dehydrogenase (short-subunit alcohol dehydrogenase family)